MDAFQRWSGFGSRKAASKGSNDRIVSGVPDACLVRDTRDGTYNYTYDNEGNHVVVFTVESLA